MEPSDKLLPQRVYLPVVLEKKINRRAIKCGSCFQAGHNKRSCPIIKYEPLPQTSETKPSSKTILPSVSSWEFELFLAAKEFFDWDITKGE